MQDERGWKQRKETGDWAIVFIRRKQGKQENQIQLPGEWGCLKQATFLTPVCYTKIRVSVGFVLLLTQRAGHSTSAAALGINCLLKYILQHAGEWEAMMIPLLPIARRAQALPWCSYPCNYSRAGVSSGLSYSPSDKVHFPNGLTADQLFARDHPVLYSPVPQREFHPLK